MTPTLTWIVGRGLLGRSVEAAFANAAEPAQAWRAPERIRWSDRALAAADLERDAAMFFDRATASGTPWRLLWCAGAGVIATSPAALAQETAVLERLLAAIGRRLAVEPALAGAGALFFASSAGAVYAASAASPPFDETSPVGALAPYGYTKLEQERAFAELADACDVPVLVGRVSNLYGPGQNLSKPQGLIGHVGQAALRREPISIYVPLDTIRDYLFAADAGRMIADAMTRLERDREHAPRLTIKIFASEVETTVATVLGAWRQALRRPLRVALADSPVATLQPRVLSFRSRVWPDLRREPTLLPLGIEAVRRDQLARLMAACA